MVVSFNQKAGIEGGLMSTVLAKPTNSLETVAVGPVEGIRPREAPYKVYPPKFQIFALKGAKFSG